MQDSPHVSPFDAIRKIADDGSEYWSARELYKILGYTEWRNFNNTVIKRAMKSCEENGFLIADHFVQSYKMASLGSGSKRQTEDYHLTRYACYLTVMNGDPKMPVVAMGQQYFAVQTRRQEIEDELALAHLPEDQKRLVFRSLMSTYNVRLAETAQRAGVVEPRDFATFQDHGYMGLYEGRRENDIHALKNLQPDEKILDFMGSEELGANIFRATQADAKLKRDQVSTKGQANITHYKVGQEVREAIKRLGGTMPEDLPTPEKSIQELQREERQRLKQEQSQQQSLLNEPDKDLQ
ncbi:MAG: DNA damage-inducible protein D, partial [Ktedonobacteraceae bacterium]